MAFYRKTALVEAYQYPFSDDVPEKFHSVILEDFEGNKTVSSLEGLIPFQDGYWIARGPSGDFWPVAPDVFALTYEKV